jgi:hypothetical protein
MIVFLECSDNNRSDTVSALFIQAAVKYGYPSRVRADHGGENVGGKEIMEDVHGPGRGSFIAGRSVHNSRIERLWRDVYYAVIQTFYSLFYFLESEGYLDIDDDAHLFALHLVYLPVINNCLLQFKEAFNCHPLRTEHNRSPCQLWTEGITDPARQHLTGVRDALQEPIHMFGIDPDAPTPGSGADVAIVVPDVTLSISEADQQQVMQLIPNTSISMKKACYFIGNFILVRDKVCSANVP